MNEDIEDIELPEILIND